MQINKDLELPFEYSWNLVKFLLVFVILMIIGLIIYKVLNDKIKRVSQRMFLPYVKSWYIRKLQNLNYVRHIFSYQILLEILLQKQQGLMF